MWAECDEQGYLIRNGQEIDQKSLEKLTNFTRKRFEKGLKELLEIGALKRDDRDILYSPVLVEYIEEHELKSYYGRMGGNPILRGKHKHQVKHQDNLEDKLESELESELREKNREAGKARASRYGVGTPIEHLADALDGPDEDGEQAPGA